MPSLSPLSSLDILHQLSPKVVTDNTQSPGSQPVFFFMERCDPTMRRTKRGRRRQFFTKGGGGGKGDYIGCPVRQGGVRFPPQCPPRLHTAFPFSSRPSKNVFDSGAQHFRAFHWVLIIVCSRKIFINGTFSFFLRRRQYLAAASISSCYLQPIFLRTMLKTVQQSQN